MRVAVLLHDFPTPSQTFINNQILSLLDRGVEVSVISVGRGGSGTDHASSRRIVGEAAIAWLPAPRLGPGKLADLGWLLRHPRATLRAGRALAGFGSPLGSYELVRLARAVTALKPCRDQEYLFCHFGPAGLFGLQLKRLGLCSGRLVTFFHGYDASQLVQEHGPGLYRPLIADGDIFVANSDFTRRRLLGLGFPADRLMTIPVGLFPAQFPFRERPPPAGRPVRFFTVGRLVEKKAHLDAVDAFGRLRDAGVDAQRPVADDGVACARRCRRGSPLSAWNPGSACSARGRRSRSSRLPPRWTCSCSPASRRRAATSRVRVSRCRRGRPWGCR